MRQTKLESRKSNGSDKEADRYQQTNKRRCIEILHKQAQKKSIKTPEKLTDKVQQKYAKET